MTTMTDGDALLRAICENPAEDTVRLAYADLLDEQGEHDRAEFVRAQVWLEAHPSCGGCTGREWLRGRPCTECDTRYAKRDRVRGLLAAPSGSADWTNRVAWFEPFRRFCQVTPERDGWEYTRGFVSSLTLTLADFEEHAADVFRAHPVESVTLSCRMPTQNAGHRRWMWVRGNTGLRINDELPSELFDALEPNKGFYHVFGYSGDWRSWDTPEAAHAALSAAAVAVGRRRAGLPPLPPAATRG